jgi:hypothetical protein
MNTPIPITLATEDELSETILRVIIDRSGRSFNIAPHCLRHSGKDYLMRIVKGLNKSANSTPYLLLTDLDSAECPPVLLQDWLPVPRHPNLLFRVAVHQVESWVLAHRQAFAECFSIPIGKIPIDVDTIPNSKKFLIDLVRKSTIKQIRDDIVPKQGSTAKIGPNYNGRLCRFLINNWDVREAKRSSESLRRLIDKIHSFSPVWIDSGK